MQFTASGERVKFEKEIRVALNEFIKDLKVFGYSFVYIWEKEFLEWYLDKEIIGQQKGNLSKIKLNQHITEEDLEQLEKLLDYLEL